MVYVLLGLGGLLAPAARLLSWRTTSRRPNATWQACYAARRYGLSAFPWAIGIVGGAILLADSRQTAGEITIGIGAAVSALSICWLPPAWRPAKEIHN